MNLQTGHKKPQGTFCATIKMTFLVTLDLKTNSAFLHQASGNLTELMENKALLQSGIWTVTQFL